MNGKEVIRRAIEFGTPERLPVMFELLGHDDSKFVPLTSIDSIAISDFQTMDEWGCVWEKSEVKNMGIVKQFPIENWNTLERYRWPDPTDSRRFAGMIEHFIGGEGKYIIIPMSQVLFERMHMLHGFENLLISLYEEPEYCGILADKIVDFFTSMIENIADRFPGMIDGVRFTDDWGTELNTFISPSLFESFFIPRYRKIFKACENAGWHVWLHSCGKINNFIKPLIECGVKVFNLQQPLALGISEFGKAFAGKVCFSSLCDIQKTLPIGIKDKIWEEAKLLLDCWSTPQGGFILSDYPDGEAIGVSKETKREMYNAFIANDYYQGGEKNERD